MILIKHILIALLTFLCAYSHAAQEYLRFGMTTTLNSSGMADYIIDEFKKEYSQANIKVIIAGTGAIINYAERGSIDLFIVHNKNRELSYLKKYKGDRYELFYNKFVLVGPKSDPLNVAKSENISHVLHKILRGKHIFLSRGDESGTHEAELAMWKNANINIQKSDETWYKEIGAGTGQLLNMANSMKAYTICDNTSFNFFKNRSNLKLLYEHTDLHNVYSLIIPHVSNDRKKYLANLFLQWIMSTKGEKAVKHFRSDYVSHNQYYQYIGNASMAN